MCVVLAHTYLYAYIYIYEMNLTFLFDFYIFFFIKTLNVGKKNRKFSFFVSNAYRKISKRDMRAYILVHILFIYAHTYRRLNEIYDDDD